MTLNHRGTLWLSLLLLLVIAGGLSYSMYRVWTTHFPAGTNPFENEPAPEPLAPRLPILRKTDPIRGSDAQNTVTLIEFGDYFNAEARALEKELLVILKEQRTPVRLIWRDFVPVSEQPGPLITASAARCAGDQRKFWEMHDALMRTPVIDITRMLALAKELGLDQSQFRTCVESGTHLPTIARDTDVARQANIQRSPTLFVNTKPYTGPLTAMDIASAIWNASRTK